MKARLLPDLRVEGSGPERVRPLSLATSRSPTTRRTRSTPRSLRQCGRGRRRLLRPELAVHRGEMVAWNIEGYVQDNWKVNNQADARLRRPAGAPDPDVRQEPLCVDVPPEPIQHCGGAVALHGWLLERRGHLHGNDPSGEEPAHGPALGPGSAVLDRHGRSEFRQRAEWHRPGGAGRDKTIYTWPTLGWAPRFGAAYDLTGQQKIVVRGGLGLYFDRPAGNAVLRRSPILRWSRTRRSVMRSCRTSGRRRRVLSRERRRR